MPELSGLQIALIVITLIIIIAAVVVLAVMRPWEDDEVVTPDGGETGTVGGGSGIIKQDGEMFYIDAADVEEPVTVTLQLDIAGNRDLVMKALVEGVPFVDSDLKMSYVIVDGVPYVKAGDRYVEMKGGKYEGAYKLSTVTALADGGVSNVDIVGLIDMEISAEAGVVGVVDVDGRPPSTWSVTGEPVEIGNVIRVRYTAPGFNESIYIERDMVTGVGVAKYATDRAGPDLPTFSGEFEFAFADFVGV